MSNASPGGVVAGGGQALGNAVLAEDERTRCGHRSPAARGTAARDRGRRARRCTRARQGARRRRSGARGPGRRSVAYMVPTIRQPARPGPRVTAMASMSSHPPGHRRQRGIDHRREALEVGTRRQLGNDAAVRRRGARSGTTPPRSAPRGHRRAPPRRSRRRRSRLRADSGGRILHRGPAADSGHVDAAEDRDEVLA